MKMTLVAMTLICLSVISGSTQQKGGDSKSTPSAENQTVKIAASQDASFANDYREAVLKHMAQGETVSVPIDKIGYLDGAVRLVSYQRAERASAQASSADSKTTEKGPAAEIEALANRLQDPVTKEGLKSFARKGSIEEKLAFLHSTKRLDLDNYNAGSGAVKAASDDTQRTCYDSCQTLCHASCEPVCTYDCRIVNGEQVCTESCHTICSPVCDVICHRVCS